MFAPKFQNPVFFLILKHWVKSLQNWRAGDGDSIAEDDLDRFGYLKAL